MHLACSDAGPALNNGFACHLYYRCPAKPTLSVVSNVQREVKSERPLGRGLGITGVITAIW